MTASRAPRDSTLVAVVCVLEQCFDGKERFLACDTYNARAVNAQTKSISSAWATGPVYALGSGMRAALISNYTEIPGPETITSDTLEYITDMIAHEYTRYQKLRSETVALQERGTIRLVPAAVTAVHGSFKLVEFAVLYLGLLADGLESCVQPGRYLVPRVALLSYFLPPRSILLDRITNGARREGLLIHFYRIMDSLWFKGHLETDPAARVTVIAPDAEAPPRCPGWSFLPCSSILPVFCARLRNTKAEHALRLTHSPRSLEFDGWKLVDVVGPFQDRTHAWELYEDWNRRIYGPPPDCNPLSWWTL